MEKSPINMVGKYLLVKLIKQKSRVIETLEMDEREEDCITEGVIASRGYACGEDITIDPEQEFPNLGETVIFKKYCGINKKVGDDSYRILKDEDIICIKIDSEDIPLVPIGPRLLLEIEKVEKKSKGGIILTSDFVDEMQDKVSEGTLIAYSKSCSLDHLSEGSDLPPIGTRVLYIKYAGFRHEVGEKCYKVINDEDLYGISNEDFSRKEGA